MSETSVDIYVMNPATDEIKFGNELTEGMWVLPELPAYRQPRGDSEEAQIRAQRFRRITRLTRATYPTDPARICLQFIGVWVDGYQEVYTGPLVNAWLVKKENPGKPVAERKDPN